MHRPQPYNVSAWKTKIEFSDRLSLWIMCPFSTDISECLGSFSRPLNMRYNMSTQIFVKLGLNGFRTATPLLKKWVFDIWNTNHQTPKTYTQQSSGPPSEKNS